MTDDDTVRAGASIGAALALADLEAGLALRAGGWHGHLTDGLGALLSGAAVPHPAVAVVAGGCLAVATGAIGAAGLEGGPGGPPAASPPGPGRRQSRPRCW